MVRRLAHQPVQARDCTFGRGRRQTPFTPGRSPRMMGRDTTHAVAPVLSLHEDTDQMQR